MALLKASISHVSSNTTEAFNEKEVTYDEVSRL